MWAKIHTFAASLKLKWKVLSLRPLLKDINDIHFQSHFYPFTILHEESISDHQPILYKEGFFRGYGKQETVSHRLNRQ